MTTDPTEQARRELIPTMPDRLAYIIATGGQVYSGQQLAEHFDVLGFQAPYVVARRKSTGEVGSLEFTHNPRYYFGWQLGESQ
jgi:hypothetical protein